jgi:D-alanyl-lipoteichoic acid acyltransferase DltB (MBOAT superfamily)
LIGIGANLLLLFYFKYANMFRQSIGSLFGVSIDLPPVILPLAISFYTFTQIGYLIDVAKNPQVRCGFIDYSLFVVFFPHLIAGPVVRHSEIVPQFSNRLLKPDWTCMASGMAIFMIGLFKKTLLADPAGVHADWIFSQFSQGQLLSWFSAWMGAIAYGLQIYFDFSGYSDMAIGLAVMFAIRFPTNFESPYKALNISDFWKRWHMSLTRFFRDYIYIPLGGNRGGIRLQACNVMLVFLISGLWHGAGWTFVIWGALHGLYLVAHLSWKNLLSSLGLNPRGLAWSVFAWGVTMAAVMYAWVFFRAPDVSSAMRLSHAMLGFDGISIPERWAHWLSPVPFLGKIIVGVPLVNPVIGWSWMCVHLMGLIGIAALMPNSRQLILPHHVTDIDGGSLRLFASRRLGVSHGLIAGILFMAFLYTKYSAAPSPFIYYNF